ncbi:MAG TPA: hypothetical protein VN222_08705 [Novosphingobium sp.]|nr:hypothetical protein [Novosphingobium sp.]
MAETLAKAAKNAYLGSMLFKRKNSMWRDVSPTGAIGDFLAVYRSAGPNRWRYVLGALGATGLVFSLIVREEHRIDPREPKITYINSWRENRSDAEIRASNIANQRIKDQIAAEQKKSDEELRNIYKTIGRLSGMDVNAIERKAQADREAEARAKQANTDHAEALRKPPAQTATKP